jgi:hypothetical protein
MAIFGLTVSESGDKATAESCRQKLIDVGLPLE